MTIQNKATMRFWATVIALIGASSGGTGYLNYVAFVGAFEQLKERVSTIDARSSNNVTRCSNLATAFSSRGLDNERRFVTRDEWSRSRSEDRELIKEVRDALSDLNTYLAQRYNK